MESQKNEKLKVSKGTVIRTVVLIIAIINNALALFGKSPLPIESEAVNEIVSFLFATAAALVAWWKNNSFTPEAIAADEGIRRVRAHEWD